QDDMGRGRPVPQRGREPHELVPLFTNERGIHGATDDLIKVAIMLGAIQLVEELLTHVEPGHQGKPQEMTEAKQLIGSNYSGKLRVPMQAAFTAFLRKG